MGNGNGKHAALWEVCRAFRRQEQHVCNWAKENKKKIKSKQDPLSTQSFFLLLTYLSKSASPSNHIYKSSNTFVCKRLEIIPAIMKATKQNSDSLRTDKPFLGLIHMEMWKWKDPHCAQRQRWQILQNKRIYILSCIEFLPSEPALAVVIIPSCHGTLAGLLK